MHMEIIYLVVGSFIVGFASVLTTKYTVDIHKMQSIKEKMDKIQKKIKENKKNMSPEEMKKLLDEQYSLMSQQMKFSFKSSMYSAVFAIPAIYIIKHIVGNTIFKLPFYLPFIGTEVSWIWLYIFYILIFTILIKKVLNLTY